MAIALAGCASADVAAPGGTAGSADPDAAVVAFCADWEAARRSGDTEALDGLVGSVPPVIVRADPAAPRALGEIDAACHPALGTPEARGGDRRIAPSLASTPPGLTVCSAGPTIGAEWGGLQGGGVVLYGDGDLDDPYDGPMLGLVWAPKPSGFGGDGPRTPVVVNGHDGVAGPITVFQQVVLPELGTQVAWNDGDLAIALIGRFWSDERLPELLAIAGSVEVVDGSARLPEAARPAGAVEVFAGRPEDLALAVDPTTDYDVRYREGEAMESVTLSGFVATAEEFEAFQFLTLDLDRTASGERTTIAGNAWSEASGPAVVTWREPDGAVVRVVDLSTNPANAAAVADSSRDLTAGEWADLVEQSGTCPDLIPPSLEAGS